MKELLIFAVVNFLAAMLSGAAGGGGGLISIPLLVLLGLSPSTAIATGKFGGFGISLGTSARFFKEKLADGRSLLLLSIFSAVGAVAGSLLLLKFQHDEKLLENIIGITILLVGVPLLYFRNMGLRSRKTSPRLKSVGFVLLLISVLFQAALGTGIGSLQMVVLVVFFGMSALVASATRRAMQLTVATISLAIFMVTGLVDYRFGLVSLTTSAAGGFLGAHIAVKKGNRFVINLFAATSILLAAQLLWG